MRGGCSCVSVFAPAPASEGSPSSTLTSSATQSGCMIASLLTISTASAPPARAASVPRFAAAGRPSFVALRITVVWGYAARSNAVGSRVEPLSTTIICSGTRELRARLSTHNFVKCGWFQFTMTAATRMRSPPSRHGQNAARNQPRRNRVCRPLHPAAAGVQLPALAPWRHVEHANAISKERRGVHPQSLAQRRLEVIGMHRQHIEAGVSEECRQFLGAEAILREVEPKAGTALLPIA